ncbi:MAG: hypothetical protein V1913_02015, partial [Fibrobacterota bacterium]
MQKKAHKYKQTPPIIIQNTLSDTSSSVLRQPAIIIFFLLLIVPVRWAFQYDVLPIQDLPNHLANVKILLNYHSSDFFQKNFILDLFPYPYLLQDILLSILVLMGGADFAGNCLAALAMVSIPLGLFYLIKTINPSKTYLSYFSLPFAWNMLLLKGNLNYLMGIALLLISLALLWGKLIVVNNRSPKRWWPIIVCIVLLYLAHLAAFVLFLVLVAILIFYKYISQRQLTRFAYWLHVAGFVFAFSVAYVVLITLLGAQSQTDYTSITGKAIKVFLLAYVLDWWDCYFLVPVLVLLGALVLISMLRIKEEPLPFILCGTLALIYMLAPIQIGSLVRPEERVLYLLVFILPICCINNRHVRLEKGLVICLCVVSFFLASQFFARFADTIYPSLSSARTLLRRVSPGKKLIPLLAAQSQVGRLRPLSFIDAYYVIDGNGYVPTLFSTQYMTVKYREKPVFSWDQQNDSMFKQY